MVHKNGQDVRGSDFSDLMQPISIDHQQLFWTGVDGHFDECPAVCIESHLGTTVDHDKSFDSVILDQL